MSWFMPPSQGTAAGRRRLAGHPKTLVKLRQNLADDVLLNCIGTLVWCPTAPYMRRGFLRRSYPHDIPQEVLSRNAYGCSARKLSVSMRPREPNGRSPCAKL